MQQSELPKAPASSPVSPEDVDVHTLAEMIEEGEVHGVRFTGRELHDFADLLLGTSLINCEFAGADLANLPLHRTVIRQCTFRSCRMTGVGLGEAALRDVLLSECQLNLASFRFSNVLRVRFDECVMAEADFTSGQLRDTHLAGCDLTGADFTNLQCATVAFERCTLDEAKGIAGLRGARFPWNELLGMAPQFAAALGIGALPDPGDQRK